MTLEEVMIMKVITEANQNMADVVQTYITDGMAKDNMQAVKLACKHQGPHLANILEHKLRSLGAKDVIVTCP